MDKFLLKWKKDEADRKGAERTRIEDNSEGPSEKKQKPSVPEETQYESVDSTTDSHNRDLKEIKNQKPSKRAFERWKATNSWIHLNAENKAVCLICTEALERNLIFPSTPESQKSVAAWVKNGFTAWASAADRIKKHSVSAFHTSAYDILKQKGASVYQCLSDENKKQMMDHRVALKIIFRTLRLFARQGIPFRGNNSDENSNFLQFLKERAEDVSELETWLKRTEHKWLSPDIQNEILELMANNIVRSILKKIRAADCYSIMIDETPDNARKEQISICFRVVSDDLNADEFFIGFYATPSTKAETLCKIVEDTLVRCELSITKLRGQCFDGAKNVSGEKTGLQKRIRNIESRAVFNHCKAHNLNLVIQDAMGDIQEAKNFIGIAKEIIVFVRDSPKRNELFERIQSEIAEDENPALVA